MRIQRIKAPEQEHKTEEVNLDKIDPVIKKYSGKKGILIPLLQEIQAIYGYIPRDAFFKVADQTNIKLSEMYGVATFYTQFRLNPVGKYIIKVCHGTACHVQGAKTITVALEDNLKI